MPQLGALVVARRREQQPGHELRGRGGIQGDGAAADGAAAVHDERQRAAAAVVDRRAELAQPGQQRLDRPHGRPGVTAEVHVGSAQCGDRRDEPQHGARVADVHGRTARRNARVAGVRDGVAGARRAAVRAGRAAGRRGPASPASRAPFPAGQLPAGQRPGRHARSRSPCRVRAARPPSARCPGRSAGS